VEKSSNRRLAEELKEGAVKRYQERYSDFGATFMAEKLREEEEEIGISEDALRRWVIGEGLWEGKRKREWRACFGELLQFEGVSMIGPLRIIIAFLRLIPIIQRHFFIAAVYMFK
jgi:hypothetical protein